VGGNTEHIDDADLDKYVASLLAKESKETQSKYNSLGVQAYVDDERKKKYDQ
jgi:hypothetical protein